jgi:hypothetical protein
VGAGIEAASQNDTSHRNFLAVWLSTNSLSGSRRLLAWLGTSFGAMPNEY